MLFKALQATSVNSPTLRKKLQYRDRCQSYTPEIYTSTTKKPKLTLYFSALNLMEAAFMKGSITEN